MKKWLRLLTAMLLVLTLAFAPALAETTEPTATIGYAVSADSDTWDPAFTEGAMSIAEVGQISEPVYGSYGIHIIYYMSDITPGAVALEEIHDSV